MSEYENKILENKNLILSNIKQGKEAGVNKVCAVFADSNDASFRKNMIKDLSTWLLEEGYKISLKEDELQILIIEWS